MFDFIRAVIYYIGNVILFLPGSVMTMFYTDSIKGYFVNLNLMLYHICGVRIYIHGDISDELISNAIYICNHRSKFDGLVIYSVLHTLHVDLKLIMKNSIRYIPIVGSILMNFGNIPIMRNREGSSQLKNAMENISTEEKAIMIFPEGRTMSLKNKKMNDDYCMKNNLPIYQNLLTPRITGIDIISKMTGYVDMYDMTIMYSFPELEKNVCHSYPDIFFAFPQKIDLFFEHHKIYDLENQLKDIFAKKDKILTVMPCNLSNRLVKFNLYECFIGFLLVFIFYIFLWYFPIYILILIMTSYLICITTEK